MKFRTIGLIAITLLLTSGYTSAQKKKEIINDSNTPLHLLEPAYNVPYGVLSTEQIKADMDRILRYLESETHTNVVDGNSKKIITDYANMNADAQLERGAFRLASYEWGVTYSAMMSAAEATGDSTYMKYVTDRFNFLSEIAPYFKKVYEKYGTVDPQMKQILAPHALDDAGAVCTAMIKAQIKDKSLNLKPLIENYINYIMYNEYRLSDGTFARTRPQHNTLWLDDMFMGIPPIVYYSKIASDNQQNYINEAVKQVLQFADRMWVPEKKLFRHGWVEEMQDPPAFFWGRANGWALLTMSEVLDVLPKNHPQRAKIMDLFRKHIKGISILQSGEGLWHQLLDRNDSYLETSASAIYTYCIAHAINKGWIDALTYGPIANLGWQAVATKINKRGQVEGTCVGTGMAFDPAFYYYRPINAYAAHGYGPVIWAGAEMINLLNNQHPKMNDSAIQFYNIQQMTPEPIFHVADMNKARDIVAGVTRKEGKPVVFIIGDSTVKCGQGNGENNMWGWGSFIQDYFKTNDITIENWALGGRSSRTYITERLWEKVLAGIRANDYLIIDFGHNDGGPINTGRARASLKGIGNESQTVVMERNGGPETVYTFGHYMRTYIRQAKAKGAKVIVTSHTPANRWTAERVNRCNQTYGKWSKEVAENENVFYIDLNEIIAQKYEKIGKDSTSLLFVDGVHNTKKGAKINAQSVIEGLKQLSECDLNDYINDEQLNINL